MKAKEWLTKNVDFSREETEVRNNMGYCATMAAIGFAVGIIVGILIIILQFAVSNPDTQQTWVNIIFAVGILAMLGYLVYMLLPLFKDKGVTIGSKVLTTLVSLVCLAGLFIIGIYLVVLLFMLVVALGALWLGLKVWASSSGTSSTSQISAPREDYGPKSYKLDNGTTVTENSFTSGYHGDDSHDYERNLDGTFSRTD